MPLFGTKQEEEQMIAKFKAEGGVVGWVDTNTRKFYSERWKRRLLLWSHKGLSG
jgi:hypothetical protein